MDHPLIVELLELYMDQNFVYFVNPFYTGGELTDLMFQQSMHSGQQPHALDERTLKPIVYQLLRTLNYLSNKNLMHRDLKPDNILLDEN